MHIVGKGRGKDARKLAGDGAALHHFAQARRNNVVPHRQTLLPAIGVDAVKPGLHAGKQGYLAPVCHKIVAPDGHAPGPGFVQHQVEVGQNQVAVALPGQFVGLAPEARGRHPEFGDEVVLLHIAGRQGSVEIVGNGHFGQFAGHRSLIQSRLAHAPDSRAPRSPAPARAGAFQNQ